jgi:hypothetical protein
VPSKTFIVVEMTAMPEKVRTACIDFYEGHITWGKGAYLPFENWENTEEGSLKSALVIERWMESTVPELKGFRASDKQLTNPVLIHASW